MKKLLIAISLLLCVGEIFGQIPDTDIFLIEIKSEKSKISFGEPKNITERPGYDNQPVFSPDNDKILFVSMPDTTQTDIYEYDISDKTITALATTPESEYSPGYIPNFKGFSMVKVENNKAQRIYQYENTPAISELLIEGIDSVGYYRFINDTTVALIVLNNGLELYIYEIYSQQFIIASKGVGRCLLTDPETGNLIFTTHSNGETTLMMLNPETFESEFYCNGYMESKDYIFSSNGELWTGWEGKLFSLDLKTKKSWVEKADFTKSVGPFYRLAISNNGKFLALVSYKDKRP